MLNDFKFVFSKYYINGKDFIVMRNWFYLWSLTRLKKQRTSEPPDHMNTWTTEWMSEHRHIHQINTHINSTWIS